MDNKNETVNPLEDITEIQRLQDGSFKKMGDVIDVYLSKVSKLEMPLFNIQKHAKLPPEKREEMRVIYETMKKYIHNLKVLREEFHKDQSLSAVEKSAIIDISDQLLGELRTFFESISEKFKP